MGRTKTEHFSETENRLAATAKALAHPARIAILSYLSQQKSCVCGDIVDELPLSQATVSQHLKALKEAGFIKGEVEGVRVCYCIDMQKLKLLKNQIGGFLDSVESQDTCC